MALRLHQVVLSGEIDNTRHYSTRGYLELRGDTKGLHLELTGNCGPTLAGKRFQFTAKPIPEEPIDPDDHMIRDASEIDWIAHQQVGPTGSMELREVKTFEGSATEFYLRCKLGEPPPTVLKPALYLEWYSQNGRVVLELTDPEIEILEEHPLAVPSPGAHLVTDPAADPTAIADRASPAVDFETEPDDESLEETADDVEEDDDPPAGLGVAIVRLDDDGRSSVEERFFPLLDGDGSGEAEADDDEEDDDESFLPPNDELQQELDQQAAEVDWAIASADDPDDPEDLREMKLMDALIERGTGSYLIDLIEGPLQLPKPHDVAEDEAEGPLKAVLMQLAMFGIQIHVCEHFTPKETYRWLMDDILPEEIGNAELRRTQWVQCFSTGESSCPACEAEMERDHEEYERKRKEKGLDKDDPDGDYDPSQDDIPY